MIPRTHLQPAALAPLHEPVSSPPRRAYEFSLSLVTLRAVRDRSADAIRTTADEILAQHTQRGHRGLALCGVSPRVGATFLAANLAIALSQAGVSTLLVDANLRRPGLHELFRPDRPGPGLRQALVEGGLRLGDVVHNDVLPDLSLVYAGEDEGNTADELIGGERFRLFMEECLRDHDCTLVDMAAANSAADARRVATVVGYALVIARRDLSFADDITTLVRELGQDGATVIGAVLNAA